MRLLRCRRLARLLAPPMTQGKFGHRIDVFKADCRGATPGGMGPCSTQPHQIGTHTVDRRCKTALGNHRERLIVQGDARQQSPCMLATLAQGRLRLCPLCAKPLGVSVKGQASTDNVCPFGRVRQTAHDHVQPKAVEQLRTQLPLFRVHGADQDKTRSMAMGDAIALDHIGTACSHIQQHIHQMVCEQIHFVDIQHTAIGLGQHTR